MRLTGLEMQQATGGHWRDNIPAYIDGVQTDTRNFSAQQAFLALRGPNFDGHKFGEHVANQAQALIGDKEGMELWKNLDVPQLKVHNTLDALGDIAHAWREKLIHTDIIAITGSYGKTTVRSMLVHVFSNLGFQTVSTQANLNNLIGVPMTLFNVQSNTDIALIECGISEVGEMQKLASMLSPDIAIITGITSAHAEGLGGIQGVAHEKAKLLEYLKPHGWHALGSGVDALMPQPSIKTEVMSQLHGTQLTLSTAEEKASLELALPAPHWAENMAFVSNIVLHYCQQKDKHLTLAELANILANWKPVDGRLQSIQGIHGAQILDDSYNANPTSMQAALNTLASLNTHRIAILGDMAELGGNAEEAHLRLDVSQVDQLILVGSHMYQLHQKVQQSLWFEHTNALLAWIAQNTHQFSNTDTILVKASHSMHFDCIVHALTEQGEAHAV